MFAYERYGRALLRKAERIVGSRADAQDLVQALFVDLLQKGESPDLPYLYRAITNRCLGFLRDESNRARLLENHDAALRGPVRTRCDEQVIGADMIAKLARVLDERAFEIACHRYFDDMTQDEIATLLGISRKTVGKKLDDVREAVAALARDPVGGAS
ncbi:MAG: sigma-70 family RNA polymerase sigma factor [Polyangiaceae bacterium]|nr:sigma-70 family RNA polymerase sigma factor [Polyangiaceae bacterium]